MKPHRLDLHIGENVIARVVEVVGADKAFDGQVLIVGVYGSLLRVKNETPRTFKAGETISLIVTAQAPVAFRILERDDRAFERWQ